MSKGGSSPEVQWQFRIDTHEEYGKGYGYVWKDFEDACQTGAENNWQIERDFQGGFKDTTISYKREKKLHPYSRDTSNYRTEHETCLRIDFAKMEVKNLYTQKIRAVRRCQIPIFFEGKAYITVE